MFLGSSVTFVCFYMQACLLLSSPSLLTLLHGVVYFLQICFLGAVKENRKLIDLTCHPII
jgi:hypothetical protein